jgi:uncharacterized membrane protein
VSKAEYFKELEYRLRGLPERERQNILHVYEELFQKAVENGKSESEIVESLGFPRVPNWDAAKSAPFPPYEGSPRQPPYAPYPPYPPPSSECGVKPWIAAMALGFFNLVIVLGPFLGICGALIGLWVASVCLLLTPVWLLIGSGFPGLDTGGSFILFGSLAGFGAGILLLFAMSWMTRMFFLLVRLYIRFNLGIIRGA